MLGTIRRIAERLRATLELARVRLLAAMRPVVGLQVLDTTVGLITAHTIGQYDLAPVWLVASVPVHVNFEHIKSLEWFLVTSAIVPMAGKCFLIIITMSLNMMNQVVERIKLVLFHGAIGP